MILTSDLVNSAFDRMKTGTSGYVSESEVNNAIADTQIEAMELIAPLYEINTTVQDLVAPFVKRSTLSIASGILTKPEDYAHYVTTLIDNNEVYPIKLNQIGIYSKINSRKPSVEKGIYYYYMEDDNIKYLPTGTYSSSFTYLRQPNKAAVSYTVTESASDDYIEVTNVTSLEWPKSAFNLLLLLFLEKLGWEAKDQLTIELSKLGLQRELPRP